MTKRNRLLLPLLLLLLLLLSLACTVYQVGGPGVVTATPTGEITVTTPVVTVIVTVNQVVTVPATTPAPLVATVTSTGLRVRSCAGLDCHEIAWLRRGDRVRVERCQAGWAYLPQYGGWSKARYLAPNHCK